MFDALVFVLLLGIIDTLPKLIDIRLPFFMFFQAKLEHLHAHFGEALFERLGEVKEKSRRARDAPNLGAVSRTVNKLKRVSLAFRENEKHGYSHRDGGRLYRHARKCGKTLKFIRKS